MNQPTKRCATYCRVSSDRQTVENQIAEVTRLAVARGYDPVVYEEVESEATARPVLEAMLSDVRAGRVQAVAVWALDRLSRRSPSSRPRMPTCERSLPGPRATPRSRRRPTGRDEDSSHEDRRLPRQGGGLNGS